MSVRSCDSSCAVESSITLMPEIYFDATNSLPGLNLMPEFSSQRPDRHHRARPGGEMLRSTAVAQGNLQQLETSKRSERDTFADVAICLSNLHRRATIDPNGKPHTGKARLELRQRVPPDIAHEIAKAVDVEHLAAQLLDSLARLCQFQTRQAVAQRRPQRLEFHPSPKMRRGGREDVAPVKRRAHVREPVARRSQLDRARRTRLLQRQREHTVVRADEAR